MVRSSKDHRTKKNPASHAAWKTQNQLDNVNKAPYVKEMNCLGCAFTTHDKRKLKQHVCPVS